MTLTAPSDANDPWQIGPHAVSVTEPDPPVGKEPIDWMLPVTRGKPNPDTTRDIIAWYEAHQSMEDCSRMLQSGAHIGNWRLYKVNVLRRCLAFDTITARHVFDLRRLARKRTRRPHASMAFG